VTAAPAAVRPSTAPDLPIAPAPSRRVTTLATLGDSTPVGLGDPVPGGGWRGFPVLLRDALGAPVLLNPSCTGARTRDVRAAQLPSVLRARPDVAVLFVGMNDTLRSDFDPEAMRADFRECVTALHAIGAHVIMIRYHDHTRVFRLPAPLRRALRRRVDAMNAVVDAVAAAHGASLVDLHALPGAYETGAWAVDRLHPSELGHRMLAAAMAQRIAAAGFAVPFPVALTCGGGRDVTAAHRAAWLVVKGVPWLVRRGRDLGPVIVTGLVEDLRRRETSERSGRAGQRDGGGRGGASGDLEAGLDQPELRAGAGGADPGDRAVRLVLAAPGEPGDVGRGGVAGAERARVGYVHAAEGGGPALPPCERGANTTVR
jgi:lysophospholipase L1-like esterase